MRTTIWLLMSTLLIGAVAPASGDTGPTTATIDGAPGEKPEGQAHLDRRLADLAADAGRRDRRPIHGYDPATDLVTIEIQASPGEGAALGRHLERRGVAETRRFGDSIVARVPVGILSALAARPDVRWVGLTPHPLAEGTGEGVATIQADTWHAAGITGAGVEVAIIDLGFGGYTGMLGTELPNHVATFDACGGMEAGSVHGTAVAEIVHEVAPHASLYLMCVEDSFDLATAVDLAITRGVDVISHSVGWFNTGRGDGTGVIMGPILQSARDAGILWVNSAGNYAERHWGGSFQDADVDQWHDFAAADETIFFTLGPGQVVSVYMKWDDWPASSNDFDLYLLQESGGTITYPDDVVASSIDPQTGSQPPTEFLQYQHAGGPGMFHLAIRKASAAGTPPIDLFVFGAGEPIDHNEPARSLNDLAGSPIVVAAGAFDWDSELVEDFSSRGPNIDGATKPDLTGPDAVSNTTYGVFAGTSAAAPHVAGTAALLRHGESVCSPAALAALLTANTAGVAPVPNDDYGYGRLLLGAPPAADDPVVRYAGANRHATAAETSQADFPCGARTVFIATGANFPDALAGAAVAPRFGAPILLVQPGSVPGATSTELTRLSPDSIVILGGEGAVGASVASELGAYGTVTRLAGANRYATAVAISGFAFPDPSEVTDVVVASGAGFADALSGAPVAAALGAPVLLTAPDALPGETITEITRLDPDRIWVLGGPAAVSNGVVSQLAAMVPATTRVAGANRYATGVAVSGLGFPAATNETTPSVVHRVYIAVGSNFPDALAGGSPAGIRLGPVLLVTGDSIPQVVADEIARLDPMEVVILGGTGVISPGVEEALEALVS